MTSDRPQVDPTSIWGHTRKNKKSSENRPKTRSCVFELRSSAGIRIARRILYMRDVFCITRSALAYTRSALAYTRSAPYNGGARYRFVHDAYPYERWRRHSTICLLVPTRRDDLEGSHDKLFFGPMGPLGLTWAHLGPGPLGPMGPLGPWPTWAHLGPGPGPLGPMVCVFVFVFVRFGRFCCFVRFFDFGLGTSRPFCLESVLK